MQFKLLGCPFCGEAPAIEKWHSGGPEKRFIYCINELCAVSPGVTGETPQEAIDHWNKRPSKENQEFMVEI